MTPAAVWRMTVLACGVALLALFAFLYRDFPAIYFDTLRAWGEAPFRFPFLDSHAVLAALQCTARGLDTYRDNPCDVLTRAFVYSPLVLEAAIYPVTIAWTTVAGVVLALGFLIALATLPAPRGRREWLILALATVSTTTLYAVERGNIDLFIFILIVLIGHLMRGPGFARLIGYFGIVFAAGLKFYPLILLVLTLRERRPRVFIAVNAMAVAALAVFAIHYYPALREAWQVLPSRPSDGTLVGFGALNLPRGMAHLLAPMLGLNPWTAPFIRFLPAGLLLLLTLNSIARAVAMARRGDSRARFAAALTPAQSVFLIAGASIMVGCFFAGETIAYRGIFFLLLLPGLCAFLRVRTAPLFGGTAVAIVLVMWSDFITHGAAALTGALDSPPAVARTVEAALWLVLQLVWWRIIAALLALIFCFVVTSPMGARMLRGVAAAARGVALAPEFAALLVLAFALRLGVFLLEPNIHWPDEIFQGMEPAHRLVFGTGAVAWEWVVGARSLFLPGIIAGLMEVGRLFGDGPGIINLPVAIFFAAAGCVPVACAYGWARRFSGRAGGFVAAAVPAVWVDLVYMSCHSFAEVLAADFLPAALYLGLPWAGARVTRSHLRAAGVLLGLTFALRYHLGPALAVAALAIGGWRDGWTRWGSMLAGAAVPVLVLGILDWVTVGSPFQPLAFNLWFNLADSADYAGGSPMTTLIVLPLYLWGAGFAVMIFTAFLGARRVPVMGGIVIVIFAIYSVFAHKEYRFIYPALVLIAILGGIGTAELLRRWSSARRPLLSTPREAAALGTLAWLAISATLAHSAIYREPWTRARAQLDAFDYVSRRADLCGVGLYGVAWTMTSGESGLPPRVGLDQTDEAHLDHDAPAFNYIVARRQAPVPNPRYQRQACFHGDELTDSHVDSHDDSRWAIHICVWRRDGGCDAAVAPGLPVNWPETLTGKPPPNPPPGWQDQPAEHPPAASPMGANEH